MLELNKIYQGDCLEVMQFINDKSIDMILCDLPYGTTACKWDNVIPFEPLWTQYKRIIKDNGAIVLTASQPFTTDLINSNRSWFKYEWIWEKTLFSNFALVRKQPAKLHENILVFYKKLPTYNPQMEIGKPYTDKPRKRKRRYEMKSEFGKGFVYNLFLFAKHFEREVFTDKTNKEYSLWFYGAKDHLIEMQIPKQFRNTEIGKLSKHLRDMAMAYSYDRKVSPVEFTDFYNKCEELMMLIDKELGLKPIKADWN